MPPVGDLHRVRSAPLGALGVGAGPVPADHLGDNSALVTRTRARYEEVQSLKSLGKGINTIMRELGLAKATVRRFYRATTVEELLAKPRAGRPSVLDEFKPYLHERWNAGCTNTSTLFREITALGYRGCRGTVAAYLTPFPVLGTAPHPS